VAVLRNWRRPPNNLQRWVAAHPFQWVGVVVGVALILASGSLATGDGLIVLIAIAFMLICAVAAWLGAMPNSNGYAGSDVADAG
jgi:hypothetical protein